MVTFRGLSSQRMKKVEMETKISQREQTQTKPVGFWEAFWFWVKLGFINFGGPAGQIAIMHRELVQRKRWISEGQYLRTLNFWHAPSRSGGSAGGNLHRVEVARYVGWDGGWFVFL